MDIAQVTDIRALKALAYDILRERERLQLELEHINLRIRQIEQEPEKDITKKPAHPQTKKDI